LSSLLSQEEVDALLAGVGLSHKEGDRADGVARSAAYVYDFKHPNRLTKDQLRSLRTIHESFAKLVATSLTTTLRTIVDVRLSSIDQVTFREFTMAMSEVDCIWVFELEDENRGIIELSPGLVFMIIDKLFGGTGLAYNDNRPATVIEQKVIKRVVERILHLWDESWQKVYPLKTKLFAFETSPQLAQIAPLSESVVVFFLEVIYKDVNYPINLCLPFFVMEPMIQSVSDQNWMVRTSHKINKGTRAQIGHVIKSTKLPMIVELGKTKLTIQEFLDLNKGDVVILNQKVAETLAVRIGSRTRFLAKPGIIGKKKAAQIARVLD
jgi:flagellar motor switch protein FliM